MDLFLQWTACIFLGQGKILTTKELNLSGIKDCNFVFPMFWNVVNMQTIYDFFPKVFFDHALSINTD